MISEQQYLKNLSVPTHRVDVILDTDAFNEVDDQFALSYLLASREKLNVKAICAAPFYNEKSSSPLDGMIKSYDEILKILKLANFEEYAPYVYKGSEQYLDSETTPVDSPAARKIVELASKYSSESPLYIIAIGAITNIASAILLDPSITEKIVIIWLGGHAYNWHDTKEFNMFQDIAAARVVFGCEAPVIQIPCAGVADRFVISLVEMEYYLSGKNSLCDFLVDIVRKEIERYGNRIAASRVIWDVTAVAWLLNDNDRFMTSVLVPSPIPEYDGYYAQSYHRRTIRCVNHIYRDELAEDLILKLIHLNNP